MYRTPSRRVERYTYDAYGQPAVYNASWTAITEAAGKDNALRFCGYVYDPDVGLYHVRHRTYTAPLGRWLQRDPAGYVDGMSVYEYCVGSPLVYTDSSGRDAASDALGGVGNAVSNCVCGPDVTVWFLGELRDQLSYRERKRAKANEKSLPNRLFRDLKAFAYQSRYLMSYKWMDFSAPGCGTGECANTVMLWGICMRKNQLGNIMFGFIATREPPAGWSAEDAIKTGYEGAQNYDKSHLHSNDYGKFAGVQRADNLAAFGIGSHLADLTKKGTVPYGKMIKGEFANNLMVLNRWSKFYKQGKITTDTLAFVPTPNGGFNTRSCKKCVVDGKPVSRAPNAEKGRAALDRLYGEYERWRDARRTPTSLPVKGSIMDNWLQSKRNPVTGNDFFNRYLKRYHEDYVQN